MCVRARAIAFCCLHPILCSSDFLLKQEATWYSWKATCTYRGRHYFNVYYTCHITARLTRQRNQHISINNRWSHNKGRTARAATRASVCAVLLRNNESFFLSASRMLMKGKETGLVIFLSGPREPGVSL